MRRYYVAGNWKMNTLRESGAELAAAIAGGARNAVDKIDITVCPPFPYLQTVVQKADGIAVGAQNCWQESSGAFTGEVAPEMLIDIGCRSVILGHSERRQLLGESDELINAKTKKALSTGLEVILCIGETQAEREGDQTEKVLEIQLTGSLAGIGAEDMAKIVIAYEPVWAIGTGLTATPDQAQAAHKFVRTWITGQYGDEVAENIRILYGGSVKPDNASELLSQVDVDGALVGGASLKADSFLPIIEAAVVLAD